MYIICTYKLTFYYEQNQQIDQKTTIKNGKVLGIS